MPYRRRRRLVAQRIKLLEQWVIIKQRIAVADHVGQIAISFITQVGSACLDEAKKAGIPDDQVDALKKALDELEANLTKSKGQAARAASVTS